MNPYGLVAAASTTSQMSIPIRSERIASSLTSAMLTERKMFSSSLVISAASGVDTRTISSQIAPVQLGGAIGARRRHPADHLRRVAQRVVGAPRVDALGRERDVDVLADAQLRLLLEERHQPLARRPGIRGRLEHDELAALEHLPERVGRLRSARPGRARGWASAASARRSAPRRCAPAAGSARWREIRGRTACSRSGGMSST